MIYLHGFASGPSSSKAQAFARRLERLGVSLVVPQLDEHDFEHMTISSMRRVVEESLKALPRPHVIIGSSLGGYLAALHASEHPVDALVLMAPAVNFHPRLLMRHSTEALTRWRAEGHTLVDHYIHLRPMRLSSAFLEDAARHPPEPSVHAPTLVFQGRNDDVVSFSEVEHWVSHEPTTDLVALDDGHALTASLERILDESLEFLADLPSVRARWPSLGR